MPLQENKEELFYRNIVGRRRRKCWVIITEIKVKRMITIIMKTMTVMGGGGGRDVGDGNGYDNNAAKNFLVYM